MCILVDSCEDAHFYWENYLLSCQFEKKRLYLWGLGSGTLFLSSVSNHYARPEHWLAKQGWLSVLPPRSMQIGPFDVKPTVQGRTEWGRGDERGEGTAGWRDGLVFNQKLGLMRTCVSKTTRPRHWLTQAEFQILFITREFYINGCKILLLLQLLFLLLCCFWLWKNRRLLFCKLWNISSNHVMTWLETFVRK